MTEGKRTRSWEVRFGQIGRGGGTVPWPWDGRTSDCGWIFVEKRVRGQELRSVCAEQRSREVENQIADDPQV